MANYQETTGEGSTWKRCRYIAISNPILGAKSVTYHEEIAAKVGETSIGGGGTEVIHEVIQNFDQIIPLRNPETGELTGTNTTYAEVYSILYSAYMQAALARDAANAPTPEPAPEPAPEPTPGP